VERQQSLYDIFKDSNIFFISDSDLDGVSAFVLARYILQPICKNFYYEITPDRSFGSLSRQIILEREIDYILFVDTTPSLDFYVALHTDVKGIYIFDHHVSGKYDLGEQNNYFFTTEKCGSKIFYDELSKGFRIKKIVSQYIELVDIYDRWQNQSLLWNTAKDLHNIMYGMVNWFDKNLNDNTRFLPFVNKMLDKFVFTKSFYLTPIEISLAKEGAKKEKTALDMARKTLAIRKDGEGNSYFYFECVSKLSYVANILLNEYGDRIKYCLGYSTFDKSQKKISIRSVGEFDCSLLAKLHGGGGHKNASAVDLGQSEDFFIKLKMGEAHLI
jgi:oligoribonuclease NrnB/cAMP/cGMP phosphodiesterase (DHH superfamily)